MKFPMLQIGGGKTTAVQARAVGILERLALRAIELGRNDVAIEAVKALATASGGQVNTNIHSCSFSGR